MKKMIEQAKVTMSPEQLAYFNVYQHWIERDMQNAYHRGGDSARADVLDRWVILCEKLAKDLENF